MIKRNKKQGHLIADIITIVSNALSIPFLNTSYDFEIAGSAYWFLMYANMLNKLTGYLNSWICYNTYCSINTPIITHDTYHIIQNLDKSIHIIR